MMSYLLSLPRASWKARLLAACLAMLIVGVVLQQSPYRHDSLAAARWMAWFYLVAGALYGPRLLVVCVFGRLPRVYARMLGRGRAALPQLHADLACERRERRGRSRDL